MWARGRLDQVALATFAVDPARLAELLAPGIEPATVTGAGGDVALVSAVTFVANGLRIDRLPLVRFSGGHVDYRAAVVSPEGEPAVWFLGAAMSSPLAWGLRWLWAMPWHRAAVRVDHEDGRYRAVVDNHRWTATIEADSRRPTGELDGFERLDQAADVLVNTRLGLFSGRRGRLAAYRVEHTPPPPTVAQPVRVRVALFEDLGLVDPGARPHSVLLVGGFDIAIELPPRPVAHPNVGA